MRVLSPRFFFLALACACAFSLCFAVPASAQTTCINPGEVPITDANRADATAAGIPTNVNCWNPSSPYAGADAGEAKIYLRSILCPPDGDNYGGMGPDQTIEKLDAKFSICAAKFLKGERSNGVNVCIREGARTVAKQQEYVNRGVLACNKGAGCEHPRGIAIDVNVFPNKDSCTSYAPLHQLAGQFGLKFYLGCRDAYHMVPAIGACTSGGVVPTGGATLPPTFYDFPAYAQQSPYSAMPSSVPPSLMSPAPAPLPQQTPQTQNQTQTQSCNPTYSCSANTMYYQTSACTTQVYQTCYYGCNSEKSACRTSPPNASSTSATSSSVGNSIDINNTNDNSNTNSGSSTSVSDILNSIIGGNDLFSSTDTGTSVPLTLIAGTHQIASLQASSTLDAGSTVFASGTIVSMQPIGGQSTFTSQDLGNQPAYVPAQNNFALSVLENMKNALLSALNFLRSLVHA